MIVEVRVKLTFESESTRDYALHKYYTTWQIWMNIDATIGFRGQGWHLWVQAQVQSPLSVLLDWAQSSQITRIGQETEHRDRLLLFRKCSFGRFGLTFLALTRGWRWRRRAGRWRASTSSCRCPCGRRCGRFASCPRAVASSGCGGVGRWFTLLWKDLFI